MTDEFISVILDFLKSAGRIANRQQKGLSANLKADMSVVTQADLNISKLFKKKIKSYLDFGGHGVLDEEDLPDIGDLFKNTAEYIWTLDPIDGTNTYYHGFPLWAIAVGLYRNFKPYIGAIYMPSTGELLYTDGANSYLVSKAFTRREKIITLNLDKRQVFTGKDIVLHRRICNGANRKYTIIDLYSNYVIAFYTLAGRSVASFFGESSKLWDISATLPIAKNIGLCFRNVNNDKDLEDINSTIIGEDWSLNNRYIMCSPDMYDSLKTDNIFIK